jgi:hypothetical protein
MDFRAALACIDRGPSRCFFILSRSRLVLASLLEMPLREVFQQEDRSEHCQCVCVCMCMRVCVCLCVCMDTCRVRGPICTCVSVSASFLTAFVCSLVRLIRVFDFCWHSDVCSSSCLALFECFACSACFVIFARFVHVFCSSAWCVRAVFLCVRMYYFVACFSVHRTSTQTRRFGPPRPGP